MDEEEQKALIAATVFCMCLKQENIKYDNLQQENKLSVMRNFKDYICNYILASCVHIGYYDKFHELFWNFHVNFPINYFVYTSNTAKTMLKWYYKNVKMTLFCQKREVVILKCFIMNSTVV